jgi:UPF0176 protein
MTVVVAAFYKFVRIEAPAVLRVELLARLAAAEAKGTILIAPEGINGTISAPPPAMADVIANLRADPRFADLAVKQSDAAAHPFEKLKVKVKREIITFRRAEADPTVQVGRYVKPEDWNALIADPDVVVIDTRNAYEIAAGTFPRAIDPGTRHFTQFPAFVAKHLDPARHKRIAMFCTGGIRCEKASAYLLAHGFNEVHHLEGGILNYLKTVPAAESLWQGDCFVFDAREGVDHDDA